MATPAPSPRLLVLHLRLSGYFVACLKALLEEGELATVSIYEH